jgi:hypothetical protein
MEAPSPASHHLRGDAQPTGDLGVGQPRRGVEHELGALHLTVRPRVARRPVLELNALLIAQDDLVTAATRHR